MFHGLSLTTCMNLTGSSSMSNRMHMTLALRHTVVALNVGHDVHVNHARLNGLNMDIKYACVNINSHMQSVYTHIL